jgi:RND family efflux transporter MFP subunit
MTKAKFLILGVIVVGLGAGVTAVTLRTTGHETSSGSEPAETAANIQVRFVNPRKGALEKLCVQPGSIHSFESIQLFAQVAGFLKFQKVDIGDPVKKGVTLAIVDVPDIQAQVERNTAAVAKAKAQLIQMKSRVDVAEANLKAIKATVTQAEAMQRAAVAWVAYRKIQLGRMDKLVGSGSIDPRLYKESKERKTAAEDDEKAAGAKIETTQADVIAGMAKIEQAKADVIEAEAQIRLAEADLEKSQVNLRFATIKAPFDGDITYRSMNPGDFVRAANAGANTDPLLTIHRTDLFRVVVLVPDRDVAMMSVGMLAMLQIDALPGRTFYPKVSRMGTTLDAKTRLMRVELDLPQLEPNVKDEKIYHGMYGLVTIVLKNGAEQLSIPTSCVAGKIEGGKGSVYVIRAGRAKKIDLQLGMDSGLRVEVVKVLTPGEVLDDTKQVIIEPTSDLASQPEVTGDLWDDSSTIQSTKTKK